MVEAMYEQSHEFSKKIQKNFKFFILNTEADTQQLPLNISNPFSSQRVERPIARRCHSPHPCSHRSNKKLCQSSEQDDFNQFRFTLSTLIFQTSNIGLQ